jgi:predicted GH43/DUF377 family glycosyl hydrolase
MRLLLQGGLFFLLSYLTSSSLGIDQDYFIGPFTRVLDSPIITPDNSSLFYCPLTPGYVAWESLHTFNPAAIVKNNTVFLFYRSEDNTGPLGIGMHVSRIGLATSLDGVNFKRDSTPVFYPDHDSEESREWKGGCEDPRVVEGQDGKYYMYYTQYSREHQYVGLGVASSEDLRKWIKHGPVFAKAYNGKYTTLGSTKSGAVVTKEQDGRLVAAQINGKYWMYWGEGGVKLAWSLNLVDWTVVEDGNHTAIEVLPARKNAFDAGLAEAACPALVTDKGIVVFYNGKNGDQNSGDPRFKPGSYSGAQALFSLDDPLKLLQRSSNPYFKPERDWETKGQYTSGTTFVEGLVLFKGKYFMYYGAADSFVGVASAEYKAFK